MSALSFRKIEKTDLEDVFVLLNQLKEKDVDSIDKDSSWKNFSSNTRGSHPTKHRYESLGTG